MSENLNRRFYLKITQEEAKKQRTQETMNELEVSVWLLNLSMVYTVACWFIALYSKNSQIIALVAYAILLVDVSWAMLRIKKKVDKRDEESFVLSAKRSSALFNLLLIGNSLYFLVCGIRGGDGSLLSMATTNATLYIGFAVSLEGLFKIEKCMEVFRCFYAPFADFCRDRRDWVKIIVATALIVFLGLSNSRAVMIVIFVIAVIMLIAVCCLDKYRKESLRKFCKFIVSISSGKQVLIWEMGGSSIVRKRIQKELADIDEGDLLVSVDGFDAVDKWDLIIVLNSIYKKKEYF